MLRYLLTQFSPTLLITILMLATYLLQQSTSPLLFLPAGVQIIAGFTYGLRSLAGCIIGMGLGMALLAHQPLGIELLVISAAYGMLSTLCLLSFIHLVRRFGHVNHELVGLSYKHILVAVMLQATADAALRTWLIPAVEHPHTNPAILFQWLSLASGNLLGSMSVVLSIFLLTALPRKNA